MQVVAPEECMERLRQELKQTLLDVRSEPEFGEGHVPYSRNLPILTGSERHQVGMCYKEHGQDAATKLGHQLVEPTRAQRVAAWQAAIEQGSEPIGLVMCWRGGLRSQVACQWLAEAGVATERIEGGYKAVRRQLVTVLEAPRQLLVLGGMTGSGKTELLQSLSKSKVDLEGAACHRGSAFGSLGQGTAPAQATFENDLALQLLRAGPLAVVEDESRMLGRLQVPMSFFQKMENAPLVMLEDTFESRVQRIYREYVAEPLARGMDPKSLHHSLEQSLMTLKRRLDRYHTGVAQSLAQAFAQGNLPQSHSVWIGELLERYYDPRYRFALERANRPVVFKGGAQACREFIEKAIGSDEVSPCLNSG